MAQYRIEYRDHSAARSAAWERGDECESFSNADERRVLVQHKVSGELFIADERAVYDDTGECVGTRFTAVAGPIARPALGISADDELGPSKELYERIDDWQDLDPDDADWLQAAEDAGLTSYPIGAR